VAGGKDERDANFEWVFQLFPVLERKRTNVASTLSGGEQQMLAIAQAVMSRPSVLLLDEPSAGLAPILARQVFERVQLLRERGISVLMVEQVVALLEIAGHRSASCETARWWHRAPRAP
jgi:branched-chain amino acid transport system ATP-binding protein